MFHHRKLICVLLLLCTFAAGQKAYAQDTATSYTGEEETVQPATYQEEPAYEATDEEVEEETGYRPDMAEVTPPPARRDRAVSATQWHHLSKDDAFRYEEPAPPKASGGPSAWQKFLLAVFSFFTSGAGSVLIFVIIALIVVLIIVRIFQLKGNVLFARKDKKLPNGDVDETSDIYVPDNWEKAIQDAAAAGNYRLAVRHGYRYLLHVLGEKEMIRFQAAKTNYQYAYDLSETRLYKPFLQLTRNYEYAWYGGFPISKEAFESYLSTIRTIQKDLK